MLCSLQEQPDSLTSRIQTPGLNPLPPQSLPQQGEFPANALGPACIHFLQRSPQTSIFQKPTSIKSDLCSATNAQSLADNLACYPAAGWDVLSLPPQERESSADISRSSTTPLPLQLSHQHSPCYGSAWHGACSAEVGQVADVQSLAAMDCLTPIYYKDSIISPAKSQLHDITNGQQEFLTVNPSTDILSFTDQLQNQSVIHQPDLDISPIQSITSRHMGQKNLSYYLQDRLDSPKAKRRKTEDTRSMSASIESPIQTVYPRKTPYDSQKQQDPETISIKVCFEFPNGRLLEKCPFCSEEFSWEHFYTHKSDHGIQQWIVLKKVSSQDLPNYILVDSKLAGDKTQCPVCKKYIKRLSSHMSHHLSKIPDETISFFAQEGATGPGKIETIQSTSDNPYELYSPVRPGYYTDEGQTMDDLNYRSQKTGRENVNLGSPEPQ